LGREEKGGWRGLGGGGGLGRESEGGGLLVLLLTCINASALAYPLSKKEYMGLYRVRTISNGARSTPAIPAAATAMPRLAHGDGESAISSTPVPKTPEGRRPGSGMLRSAARRDRVQHSMVLWSTL